MNSLFKSKKKDIFQLIDDYKYKNNQKLIKYIKKYPLSLFELNPNTGISVYSYATIKGLNCLKDVHETYITTKKNMIIKGINSNIQMTTFPYEIESMETKNRPIHYAVQNHLNNELEYLINEVDVNVNSQNKDGDTPLHIACKFGYKPIVVLLANSKKIKFDILNNDMNTPLYIAAINKYKKITDYLLRKGASLKVKKQGKNKIYEFDIFSDILSKGDEYYDIIKIFYKFKKMKQKEKKFKNLRNEYKFICDKLKNQEIDDSVKILSRNLGLTSIENMSKDDLCKKLAQRIIIYSQNPELIEDNE